MRCSCRQATTSAPDLPRHVELLDGQAARLDLRVGLGGDLLGSVTACGAGKVWAAVSATTVLISMTIAKSAQRRMARILKGKVKKRV